MRAELRTHLETFPSNVSFWAHLRITQNSITLPSALQRFSTSGHFSTLAVLCCWCQLFGRQRHTESGQELDQAIRLYNE